MDHPIEVDVKGQVYRWFGFEYCPTAKSGRLAVWLADCPDCGATFEVKFPGPFTPNKVNRRCANHRKPGVRV